MRVRVHGPSPDDEVFATGGFVGTSMMTKNDAGSIFRRILNIRGSSLLRGNREILVHPEGIGLGWNFGLLWRRTTLVFLIAHFENDQMPPRMEQWP